MNVCTKYCLTVVILLFVFIKGISQKKTFEYGLQTAVNFNTVSGNSLVKGLTGFGFGAHFKVNTSANFGIKAILQYDQQGFAYRSLSLEDANGNDVGKADILFKLNYLNLPLVAEFSFGKKIRFTTSAGFFAGILVNNKTVVKFTENTSMPDETGKSDAYKSTNFGLSFGAGVQVPVCAKTKLGFAVTDNYGLTSIYKSGSSIKTNALSVTASVSFSLAK